MTHDELIAYIDDSTDGLKHEHLFEKLLANTNALRAVVELAGKDIEHESYVWLDGYDYAIKQIIQAIEKELS